MRKIDKAADYDNATTEAVQALSRGDATAAQQVAVLRWILEAVTEVAAPNFATSPHEMAFCEGRRSVGVEIARLVHMPAKVRAAMREAEQRGLNAGR